MSRIKVGHMLLLCIFPASRLTTDVSLWFVTMQFFFFFFLESGQPVDAYAQPPPGPWDIPATAPSYFTDSQQIIKVPYTSSMKVQNSLLSFETCANQRERDFFLFFSPLNENPFINRAVTFAWEWGGRLAKTVPAQAM